VEEKQKRIEILEKKMQILSNYLRMLLIDLPLSGANTSRSDP